MYLSTPLSPVRVRLCKSSRLHFMTCLVLAAFFMHRWPLIANSISDVVIEFGRIGTLPCVCRVQPVCPVLPGPVAGSSATASIAVIMIDALQAVLGGAAPNSCYFYQTPVRLLPCLPVALTRTPTNQPTHQPSTVRHIGHSPVAIAGGMISSESFEGFGGDDHFRPCLCPASRIAAAQPC
jgi:hypothetical protein